MNLLGQILTLISYLVFWASRFFKGKREILLCDNISRIIAIFAFLCLYSINGIENTIFAMVRNYCGQKTATSSVIIKRIAFFILLLIVVIMYVVTFQGISTLTLIICAILNLIGVILCNEQGMRLFGLAGSLFYMAFLYLTQNYIGAACELICAVVLISSYLYYHYWSKNQNG